ncbi:MAG: leucine-rich repeat domain-containing protein [Gammaproteobacteria bacterium]|nr:leucine-rich repeat domain-containing protein [Gammaproteobacteria bacterium]
MNQEQAQDEAERRITEAKASASTKLDLSGLDLERLPDSISELTKLTHLDCSKGLIRNQRGRLCELAPLVALYNLTSLNCSGNKIADLGPLAALDNLKWLVCAENQISDLGPLAAIDNLTSLNCARNQIADLGPLAAIDNLTSLNCARNQIADLGPLAAIDNLTSLNCARNQIADLGPLAAIDNLTSLNCSGNQIADLGPLAAIDNLSSLACSFNQIYDLQPLAALDNLTSLDCSYNQITDLAPLAAIDNLSSLACSFNQIYDLEPLAALDNLTSLDCSFNQITDLAPLAAIDNLTSLGCARNQITDLGPLTAIDNLTSLNCARNQIADLGPLAAIDNLTSLNCARNQITDLGPLAEIDNLTSLNCSGNKITNLGHLAALDNLTTLDCSFNQIYDLEPLAAIDNLTALDCSFNQIYDLEPLAALDNLTSLDCGRNQIADLGPLAALANLHHLHCQQNQIQNVPPEITEQSNCIDDLRSYWDEVTEHDAPNRWFKAILIGNGWVGKSTLADALIHDRVPPQTQRTHAIVIENFSLPLGKQDHADIQLWDCGGQELYHATHRLFLTTRAIFLLVWAAETPEGAVDEANHPLSYWLDLIPTHHEVKSTILIQNRVDKTNGDIDGKAALSYTQNAIIFGKEIATVASKNQHVGEVRERLKSLIGEYSKRWNYKVPASWEALRSELDPNSVRILLQEEYLQLCHKHKVKHPQALLGYLHRGGALFYRKGFLNDALIVDQRWFIDRIYRLFRPESSEHPVSNRETIIRKNGVITGLETTGFWSDHPQEKHREVLMSFMIASNTAFELTEDHEASFNQRRYLIPALVSETRPAAAELDIQPLYQLRFETLHRGIMDRIIGRLCRFAKQELPYEWWAMGIIISDADDNTRVQVDIDPTDDNLLRIGNIRGNSDHLARRIVLTLKKELGDDAFESIAPTSFENGTAMGTPTIIRHKTSAPEQEDNEEEHSDVLPAAVQRETDTDALREVASATQVTPPRTKVERFAQWISHWKVILGIPAGLITILVFLFSQYPRILVEQATIGTTEELVWRSEDGLWFVDLTRFDVTGAACIRIRDRGQSFNGEENLNENCAHADEAVIADVGNMKVLEVTVKSILPEEETAVVEIAHKGRWWPW